MSINKKFNLKLEKYLLDELSPEERKNLEQTPNFKEDIKELEDSNKMFFEKFDISKLSDATEKRSKKESKIISFPTKTITTIAAAAACFVLAINIIPSFKTPTEEEEIIYLKGREKINLYLKSDNKIKELNNLDFAKENDKIQITYNVKNSYGVIFSLDGLNNITYHYPENITNTTNLDIGKEVTLPTSYTLDNAPYFEKFYLITSNDSFDINLVNSAISKIKLSNGIIVSDLELPSKYSIKSITLQKE